MDELDYWSQLEFRVCREFNGIEECRKLGLWCDGLRAQEYALDADPPLVRGKAWVCPGQEQQEWGFTLVLNQRPTDRQAIDWEALLPAEDVTEWLVLDFKDRYIVIDPGAAVADPP